MDTDEFRKHGHEFVDWLAGYMENIESYPVHPDIEPGDIKAKLPDKPPEKGESIDKIFKDFQ